jgi:CRISPR-associated protein Cmr2
MARIGRLSRMDHDWEDLLIGFLHDPPDKAMAIRGHEGRACRYLQAALEREVSNNELHGTDDQLASQIERLPMPVGKVLAVGPENGSLTVLHPLSAERFSLPVGLAERVDIEATIQDICRDYQGYEQRFLALWRLLPARLESQDQAFARLPADTRVPDHTIWHHLDITAAFRRALSGSRGGALLSFALGPVQPFIEAAQSVRDLWTGSMILSWLSFHAMLPVIKQLGPTAVMYPALRGNPFLDRWLRDERQIHGLPSNEELDESLRSPCLPHRFLAIVPAGVDGEEAEGLARKCADSARTAWQTIGKTVRERLNRELGEFQETWPKWADRWDRQVDDFFDFRTSILPRQECGDEVLTQLAGKDCFDDAFPEPAAIRRLATLMPEKERPRYDQATAGRWQAQVELSARLMEATRTVRHIPPSTPPGETPPKCSLLGSYEQMGPNNLAECRQFWEEAAAARFCVEPVRIRSRERFSAVTLTKRFAGPTFFAEQAGFPKDTLRFEDTAGVAAAAWIEKAGLDIRRIRRREHRWNGQWLFASKQDYSKDDDPIPDAAWKEIKAARSREDVGWPPSYYAILTMDGDHMGEWMSGAKSPEVRNVLAPAAREYFETLARHASERDSQDIQKGLKARRELAPARHAAISGALANFALYVVPRIVKKHRGTLIYAGGDDVLALVPCSTSLDCACELRLAFSGDSQVNGGAAPGYYRVDHRDLMMMGPTASASTGVAIVHYMEDLRQALQSARHAEKAAKHSGRDVSQIAVCRRSGEHTSALCPWGFVDQLQHWTQAFQHGASDRWAYHLRQDLLTLEGLPREAAMAEIRRQIDRSELKTRELLSAGPADAKCAGSQIARAYDQYDQELRKRGRQLPPGQTTLAQFVLLCQTASFLARGGRE